MTVYAHYLALILLLVLLAGCGSTPTISSGRYTAEETAKLAKYRKLAEAGITGTVNKTEATTVAEAENVGTANKTEAATLAEAGNQGLSVIVSVETSNKAPRDIVPTSPNTDQSVSAVAEKPSVTDEDSVEEAALSELRSAHRKAVMTAIERENEAPRTAILGKDYGGFKYPTRDFYATYKGPLSTSRFGNGFARQHLNDAVSPNYDAPSLIDAAFEFYERGEFEQTVHFLMLAEYRNANSQNRLKLYGMFHRDLAVSEESTFSMLLASSSGLLADAYLEGTSKEKNLYAAYIYYAVAATDGSSQPAAVMAAYLNFQEDAGESASIPWWLANKVKSFTKEGRVWLLRASSCTKYDFERNIAAELDVCIAALREYLGIVADNSQKIINRLMNSRLSYKTGQRMLREVQFSAEIYEREELRLQKLLNLKK